MRLIIGILLMISFSAHSKTVDYSWDEVNQATDGTTIKVDSYNLYCSFGDASTLTNSYQNVLAPGDYSCKLTAVLDSVESLPSQDFPFTVEKPVPEAPKSFKVIFSGEVEFQIIQQ